MVSRKLQAMLSNEWEKEMIYSDEMKEKIIKGGIDEIFKVYDELEEENARLREIVRKQQNALNQVEWVNHPDSYPGICPWCYEDSNKPHAKDCVRQIAIKLGEGI